MYHFKKNGFYNGLDLKYMPENKLKLLWFMSYNRIKKIIKSMKRLGKKQEDRIDNLSKKFDVLTDQFQIISKQMMEGFASIHKEINSLKDDVAILKTDVAILKEDVGDIKTRLNYIVKANKLIDLK